MDGFFLTRTTRDGKTFIALVFNTNVKRDRETLLWADKYEKCHIWVEATPTSPNMPSKPVPGEQMTIADVEKSAASERVPADNQTEDQVAKSQENISEFFHVEAADKGDSEPPSEVEQLAKSSEDEMFSEEYIDENGKDVTDEVKARWEPKQSAEAAAAVAEIPAGHEECIHCHKFFPRSPEPANWVEGKCRKSSKAPLAVRKLLGTSFGSICGGCVNELTPKPEQHDDEVSTVTVN